MANDLAAMKARIADELARSNLTSQIPLAITDAIAAYQTERFYFNETRTLGAFNTVASQEFYTTADNALIPDWLKIDWATVTISGKPLDLPLTRPKPADEIAIPAANGQPISYSYYDRKIRIYPIPDTAYPLNFTGHYKVAAPQTDSEANNIWMTDCERLIRFRAKYELALHKMRNTELAQMLAASVEDALAQLRERTTSQIGTGQLVPVQF